MPDGRRSAGRGALALAAYLLAAVVFTWPLALSPRARIGATEGIGDPYLNTWILGWDLRTLSAHPAAAFTGAIFRANIFYPADDALTYSDHFVLQAIGVWPVYAVSGDVVLCYNVLLLASLALSGLAMHALARRLTGSAPAALAAGLAWGFCAYRGTHLIHIQLQALYLMPLTLLALVRFVAGRQRRDAVWLGLAAGAQLTSSIYYGVIGGIGLAVAATALVVVAGTRRLRTLVSGAILAALVATAVSAPWLWPYWRAQQLEGFGRSLYEAGHGSAVPASYLQATPDNLLYGRSGLLRPPAGGGGALGRRDGPEQQLFPGFTLVALAIYGLVSARRRDTRAAAMMGSALVVVGFVLSLGPDGARLVYAPLYRFVFGLHAVRAPARFAVLVMAGLCGLAALGVRALEAGGERRGGLWRRLPWLAVALVGLELVNAPLSLAAAPPAHTPTGAWLRAATEPGPVLYLPIGLDRESTPVMVASLEHGRPIVNGYSGQRPPFYPALVEVLNQLPSAEALMTLKDLGVRFVVAASPLVLPAGPTPLVERGRAGTDTIYELRWTPVLEAALTPPDMPAPDLERPLPFDAGEHLEYDVRWVGGPVGLPAGTVTLDADREGDGWRLAGAATTAAWVSRFFEARDQMETRTDADLRPLEQILVLREGRRQVDRQFLFDRDARRLRVLNGRDREPGPVLPLDRQARDVLAAFYYVRALPLEAGQTVRFPVSDGGRAITVTLEAGPVEQVPGRPAGEAGLRLRPVLAYRIDRRQTVDLTVWVSRDRRHVPLAIEARASFGALRADWRRTPEGAR